MDGQAHRFQRSASASTIHVYVYVCLLAKGVGVLSGGMKTCIVCCVLWYHSTALSVVFLVLCNSGGGRVVCVLYNMV